MRYGQLVLALLVVLTGCNGIGALPSGGSADTSTTPAAVDTTTDTTQSPTATTRQSNRTAGPDYPTGLSKSGVTDPTAFAEGYTAALDGVSFQVNRSTTVVAENGTILTKSTRRGHVASRSTYRVNWTQAGRSAETAPRTTTYYAANGTVHRRTSFADGTSSTLSPGSDPEGQFSRLGLVDYGTVYLTLSSADETTVSERPPLGEQSRFRVTATGVSVSADSGVTNVTDARATLLVRENGLVERLTLTYRGTLDGQRVTVRTTISYDAVGETTVESPNWLGTNETAGSEGQDSSLR